MIPEPLPDGIYFDLPLSDYVADRALSGGGFLKLITDPGALQWERWPENPLWEEKESSRPQLRGSASHAAILESIEAYEARYCIKPEGCLVTGTDMSAWLREAGLKISGTVAEQRARIEEARDRIEVGAKPVFLDELVGGREIVSALDDQYVRLLERFISGDAKLSRLVRDGVPEVSIFWTEDGIRFKSRPDYLTAPAVCNLKTYGRPPMRGRNLRAHLIRDGYYRGSDLQAVHEAHAVEVAGSEELIFRDAKIGGDPRVDQMKAILAAHKETPPIFHWLYLRMDGAPSAMAIPFRTSDQQYVRAAEDIRMACDVYRRFVKKCGADQLWLFSGGVQEIQLEDWPWVNEGEIEV